jgi:hypothetical protein
VAIEPEGRSETGRSFPEWRPEDDGLADPYVDLIGLARQRAAAIGAQLTQRPALLAVGAAVLVGGLLGYAIAGRRRRRPAAAIEAPLRESGRSAQRAGRRAARLIGRRTGRLAYYGELASLGLKLWENPLVRAFILQALVRRAARRLS